MSYWMDTSLPYTFAVICAMFYLLYNLPKDTILL